THDGISPPVRRPTTPAALPPTRAPAPGLELARNTAPPAQARRWTTSVVRGPSRSGATERGSEAEERRSEERDQWGPEPATPEAAPSIQHPAPPEAAPSIQHFGTIVPDSDRTVLEVLLDPARDGEFVTDR